MRGDADPVSLSVSIDNARLVYGGDPLFDGLGVTLAGGKWTCLLGSSGIGKSSLLKLFLGLKASNGAGGTVSWTSWRRHGVLSVHR